MTDLTERPLAAWDLETTSVDPMSARIVTSAFIVAGDPIGTTWILDPGIDIPPGAAAVHGYTTERARAEATADYETGYRQIRYRISTHWANGGILAVYNAAYDLTILDREGQRLGYPPLAVGPVADPFVIDRQLDPYRKGSRKLVDVLAHYYPGTHDPADVENAHAADWDARMAGRLAWKLLRADEFADYDVDALMSAQTAWHHDRQESFRQWLLSQDRADDAAGVNTAWPLALKETA